MEEQCSHLSWGYCYQEEGNEELKYSFLYTLELESTIVSAKEEIAKREFDLICLKDVLNRTIKEKDEAQTNCQKLMLENLLLQKQKLQHQHQESEDESKQDDPKKHFSIPPSADCNKDIVATSFTSPKPPQPQPQPLPPQAALSLAAEKPLPEKGELLKAVMEAGPLLQTLLLAGPLPQWQHPPPQLDSIEVPPVAISPSSPQRLSNQASFNSINSCISNKRGLELNEVSDSSPNSKYQKLAAIH